MIHLTIPGEPIGKARPRWSPHGTYSPEKTVRYETQIRERFAAVYPGHVPLTCAVKFEARAFFGIPKSASVTKAEAMRLNRIQPTKKPDASNVLKIAEDALNGLAYRDDAQIVWADIRKGYSEAPRLEIIITEIGGAS